MISGMRSGYMVNPYLAAISLILAKSGAVSPETTSASSTKYRSNPAGVMISRIRAGFEPAFQKVCGTPRGLEDLVADLSPDLPLQNVGDLVLTRVRMRWGSERPRRQGVLDDREGTVRVPAEKLEDDSDAAEGH